jgi:hypothetical protein
MPHWPIVIMNLDGSERNRILRPDLERMVGYRSFRFTPDGRKIVYIAVEGPRKLTSLRAFDVERATSEIVLPARESESISNFCISPNGERLAVHFTSFDRASDGTPAGILRTELAVVDMSGRELHSLAVVDDSLQIIDWRRAPRSE